MALLAERLQTGAPVLMDGAMGTELERRGAAMDDAAWCGVAVATSPDIVTEVHRDYLRLGAEIHIVNTYASAPHVLSWSGRADDAERINRDAVMLARRAIAEVEPTQPVWVAGSLSTFNGANTTPLSTADLTASWRRQAEWLTDAGCDLIILEMMLVNRRYTEMDAQSALLDIAHETGLPVWYGFSLRSTDGENVLPYNDVTSEESNDPDALKRLIASLDFSKLQAIGPMHSDVPSMTPALRLLSELTDLPRFAYPNSGYFKMPNWQFEDIIPVDEFTSAARGWLEQGARVLGGCCGLGLEHMEALKKLIESGQKPG